jgi:hypothetical protein
MIASGIVEGTTTYPLPHSFQLLEELADECIVLLGLGFLFRV